LHSPYSTIACLLPVAMFVMLHFTDTALSNASS
jgi:hypothetical protein